MRSYKFRKVCKLVKKCRSKNIKFDKHFIDLSFTLLNTPESMTMSQMEELRVECTEALGSDYGSTDSCSDSDNEHKCQIRKKKKPGLLVAAGPNSTRTRHLFWTELKRNQFSLLLASSLELLLLCRRVIEVFPVLVALLRD